MCFGYEFAIYCILLMCVHVCRYFSVFVYVLRMCVHRIKKSVCGVQYQCGPLFTSGVCMCAYVKGGVCMFCFACSYKMKCAMSECLCIHLCK